MKDKLVIRNSVDIKRLAELMERTQRQFEMEVEATCLEVIDIAKQISPAIGREISITEAKQAMIAEFMERIK